MSYFNVSAQEPIYDRLETIVRLKGTHGREVGLEERRAAGLQDYLGLSLMFETRDRQTKVPVWAADVAFGPKDPRSDPGREIFYEAGLVSWAHAHKGLILTRYVINDQRYASADRNYGTRRGSIPDPRAAIGIHPVPDATYHHQPHVHGDETHPDFRFQSINLKFNVDNVERNVIKSWLGASLFEWTLTDTLTISDLKNSMEEYKDSTYRYTLAGFSCRDNIINCCQFSCIALKKFGINLDRSDMIRKYTNNDYGIAGWYGVSALPFTMIGGSFTPDDVVKEILKHSYVSPVNVGGHSVNPLRIEGTRVVTITPRAGNPILAGLFDRLIGPETDEEFSIRRRADPRAVRNNSLFYRRTEGFFRRIIRYQLTAGDIGNYNNA
jgi:hypothetical protein